jgi:hypothetical protein
MAAGGSSMGELATATGECALQWATAAGTPPFGLLRPTADPPIEGFSGEVRFFVNEHGQRIAAKILHVDDSEEAGGDSLDKEFRAYTKIKEALGDDPRVPPVHGIGTTVVDGVARRALLMDAIPGPTADDFLTGLLALQRAGKIVQDEVDACVKHFADRLLELLELFANAPEGGVVHNDLKPSNIIVNSDTFEPTPVDYESWSDDHHTSHGGTLKFSMPVSSHDQCSDVFMAGAVLVDGLERNNRPAGGKLTARQPNQGLYRGPLAVTDPDGIKHIVHCHQADTPYTQFIDKLMSGKATASEARQMLFLRNRPLLPEEAKTAISKVIGLLREARDPQGVHS